MEIPLLSEIPLLGTALFSHNVLVYFAALLAVGLYFFLYRTRAGLDLRSVGENPKAADSLGIPVVWTRLWTSTAGGALMGVAGAYLPLVFTGTFSEGIVGGRGWLAIALTFFGGWRPQFIVAGALFFAAMDVVALRAEVSNVDIPSQVLLVVPVRRDPAGDDLRVPLGAGARLPRQELRPGEPDGLSGPRAGQAVRPLRFFR